MYQKSKIHPIKSVAVWFANSKQNIFPAKSILAVFQLNEPEHWHTYKVSKLPRSLVCSLYTQYHHQQQQQQCNGDCFQCLCLCVCRMGRITMQSTYIQFHQSRYMQQMVYKVYGPYTYTLCLNTFALIWNSNQMLGSTLSL